MGINRDFQIFVKPAGASCNLRCRYCYYLPHEKHYQKNDPVKMPDKVLEKYIIQHIEASDDQTIMFSWHGGEPLLAGLDFYRKAVAIQKKNAPPGAIIINGVQTNGTLIDDDFARFFADEGFLTGISIDGPGDLHNSYRITANNSPSLELVLNGYSILKKYGVTTEILCVVSSANVRYPLVVYDFFRQLDARYITFLPLVEKCSLTGKIVSMESVPAEEFGSFLVEIFDEWMEKDIGRINVQIFEEAIRTAFNTDHTLCIFKENCGGVPVVEKNGDFYSCDHFVDRDHLIGNINDMSLAEMLDSKAQRDFGELKSLTLPSVCLKCDVRTMCNGECPKNRFITSPDGEPGLNYLCPGYKKFFNHVLPFIKALRVLSKGE